MTGDDVNDAKKGARYVKGGIWAADNLHPVDQVNVNGEVRSYEGLIVDIVIDPVTIHQQQDARVVVAGATKSTYPHIVIASIVSYIKSGHVTKDVCDVAVPVSFNLIYSDNCDGGGGGADLLLILGRA